MDTTCLIISGGEFSELPDDFRCPTYVIACDRGWQYAIRLGLTPDLILGDFDSSPLPDTEIPIVKVPTQKDDTDTMLAARKALELGFLDIAICCAFGGRLDHTFANIQTAAFLAARGAKTRLFGKDTEGLVFADGEMAVPRKDGWSLSLFSLSDKCEGVSIRGTKYEVEDIALTNAFPLGVSNVWSAENAEIAVKTGILLVLSSKLAKGEHI